MVETASPACAGFVGKTSGILHRMGSRGGREGASAALLAGWIAFAASCDARVPDPEDPGPEPGIAADDAPTPPSMTPPVAPDPIRCEEVTEENTSDGAARLRFERVSIGMSPTICGMVAGPDDSLAFARYLQGRLRREPGCGSCEVNRIDLVTMLDVTLDLDGRWRPVGSSDYRRFVTYMPRPFDPTSSADSQLEDAHFFFVRDGDGYEAFYEGLCPGSNPDPDAPGPRVVSEECMRFIERPAPHMRTPGLLQEEP